jgi:hypothetical protein
MSKVPASRLAIEVFEQLDRTYSRDELVREHVKAALIQLAKAPPEERQGLWNRHLAEISNWPAWAGEMARIYQKLDW